MATPVPGAGVKSIEHTFALRRYQAEAPIVVILPSGQYPDDALISLQVNAIDGRTGNEISFRANVDWPATHRLRAQLQQTQKEHNERD